MNHWIFVLGNKNTSHFEQLINVDKNWGFKSNRQISKKLDELKKGDIIVFYLGGKKCLAGEARLASGIVKPTRSSRGEPDDIDKMVEFDPDSIVLWEGGTINLGDRNVREKLSFIKNKDNWGMSLGQSLVRISKRQYKEIKVLCAST